MQSNFKSQCQSCGMPLKNGEESGTENDGSKSSKYCHYCYKDGAFVSPDMTIDDMKKVLDDTVGKDGVKGKVLAWMGKMQLPGLERWRNSKE
ncbi:zinc ribbon domain-containing protein [Candidatus Dojkabacteria bacterium]|uniref:Zinc ribbon domain-containing protein n=1 Tax=Candidatus Dojkabacteria bacterium TaxID=2099670 RepID=A0A955L588_9BACT|nr:zinc ribbon domain-containing protein [Candidatus Dojkabacteria bacterium]